VERLKSQHDQQGPNGRLRPKELKAGVGAWGRGQLASSHWLGSYGAMYAPIKRYTGHSPGRQTVSHNILSAKWAELRLGVNL